MIYIDILEQKKPYYCYRCGARFTRQVNNFSKSKSSLFKSNDNYTPFCKKCVNELFDEYLNLYDGNMNKAVRRMCEILGCYYDISSVNDLVNVPATKSKIMEYIKSLNLSQCKGKTFEDNLIEERDNENMINSLSDVVDKTTKTKQKTVKFFGFGFTDAEYQWLQDQYDDWTTRHECSTKAQEVLFKQICLAELEILQSKRDGKGTDKVIKTLQDLMDSGDLKPKQNKDNTFSDDQTIGTLIQKWERERPIPEPDPEWQDVDGIVRYIHIYFLGHFCRMMGINNKYSRMYDEEMNKHLVEKPEYEEDSEALFDSLFGGDTNGN